MCEKRFGLKKNQSLWIWVSQLHGIVCYISIIFYRFGSQIYFTLRRLLWLSENAFDFFFLLISTLFKQKWRRAAMRFCKVSKSFHVEKKMDFSLCKFFWTIHISRMNCLCHTDCVHVKREIWNRTVIGIWIIVKQRTFIGRRRLK